MKRVRFWDDTEADVLEVAFHAGQFYALVRESADGKMYAKSLEGAVEVWPAYAKPPPTSIPGGGE